jgi:hypothetical protein
MTQSEMQDKINEYMRKRHNARLTSEWKGDDGVTLGGFSNAVQGMTWLVHLSAAAGEGHFTVYHRSESGRLP